MINYINDDLFNHITPNTIIPHVVNCKGKMGSGFALALFQRFPQVREKYLDWFNDNKHIDDNPFRLGAVQYIKIGEDVWVANMVAQTLGGDRPLYYNHLARCMDEVAFAAMENVDFGVEMTGKPNKKILAPAFGSLRAGGNWSFIEELIKDSWIRRGLDVTICIHNGEKT